MSAETPSNKQPENHHRVKQTKILRFALYFFGFSVLICLIAIIILFMTSIENTITVSNERSDCDCDRCEECVDHGDSEWIIVNAIGSPPNSQNMPQSIRVITSKRAAELSVLRQLDWCIQVTRVPSGVCVSNFLRNHPGKAEKISTLIKEKQALIRDGGKSKNNMVRIRELGDDDVEITLKIEKREVLEALGFN